MITFQWYKFSELSSEQLYSILALRADIFIVEQKRVCLDPDGKDIDALHLLGTEKGVLVAYARLFSPTEIINNVSFGRVLTAKSVRTKGYGKLLMQNLLEHCDKNFPNIRIICCAQKYLKKFYEDLGFKTENQPFEIDGIQHLSMYRLVMK